MSTHAGEGRGRAARGGQEAPLVFLLCGGLGTRLRAVEPRPKAIVPVAGRPFVSYLLRLLRTQAFERVHFLLGVGAGEVRAALPLLGELSGFAASAFSWTEEAEPLGTGGALALARDRAVRRNLVLNADSFAEADYASLAESDRAATLLAVWQKDRAHYGGLELDAEDRVLAFQEKGRSEAGWINGGAYLLARELLGELAEGASSLERDFLPRLANEGRLGALRSNGFFRDIGTPERLAAAELEFVEIGRRLGMP